MNSVTDTKAQQEKELMELEADIHERYSDKPEAYRVRVFSTYQILDLSHQSLCLTLEAHRQGGTIRKGKNGKNETVFPLPTRAEYDDFERRRNQMMNMESLFRSMQGFLKTMKKYDRVILETKLAKVLTMLRSLKNYRYVIEGMEHAPILPLAMGERHISFAKRAGLSAQDLRLLRKYGSTRMERVLELLEDRFSDFSRLEGTQPNMRPDRPFFIRQEPVNMEEDLLRVFEDLVTILSYSPEMNIKHIRPISVGNTRALREFLARSKRFDISLSQEIRLAPTNEFAANGEDFHCLRNIFQKDAFSDVVALGLGFSPGILSLLTIEPSWIKRLIAPVHLADHVLVMFYLISVLLGRDASQVDHDTHTIIERLLEFPERKGVHFLGTIDTTLGVLVQ